MTDFAARVSETRTRVTQYALSENDNDLQVAQRSLGRLENEIQSITTNDTWAGADDGIKGKLANLPIGTQFGGGNDRGGKCAERQRRKTAQSATELSTTVAAIVEALSHDTNNAGALDDAIRLMELFHSSERARHDSSAAESRRCRHHARGHAGDEPRAPIVAGSQNR